MSETGWSHRPTWPKEPKTHETDRTAILDGVKIGRVTQEDGGPRDGQWLWNAYWTGHVTGDAASLEVALQELRAAYQAELERNPRLLEELREEQRRARTYLNNWLRSNGRHDEVEE